MKKILSFILCCVLCFGLVGCEDDSNTDTSDTPNSDITDSPDDENNNNNTDADTGDSNTNDSNENNNTNDTNDNLTQDEKDRQQLEKDNPTGYYVTCPECGEKVFTVNGDWDCSHYLNNNNNDMNVNPDSQGYDYDEDENNYTKPNADDLGEHEWNQDNNNNE